jgi:hypothetical protein
MTLPSPRDIGKTNERLASNNSRVASVLNSLPGMLDQLIAAADRRDWSEVVRQSETLAEIGNSLKYETLAVPSRELAAAAEARTSELEIKRHLLRVIGAAGRTRRTSFLAARG